MKVFQNNVILTLTWKFDPDGQTLRSNTVGGFKAEIFKSHLTIYDVGVRVVHKSFCHSREKGRNKAALQIMRLLEAW